jgi:hypothetical protein
VIAAASNGTTSVEALIRVILLVRTARSKR